MGDLIARLEAATGPDRALDVLIGVAVRALPAKHEKWLAEWAGEFGPMPRISGSIAAINSNGDPAVHWEAPAYTASIDAAMTLVPADWDGHGILSWPGYDNGKLTNKARADLHHCLSSGGGPKEISFAATLPLAICIAALRARQAAK